MKKIRRLFYSTGYYNNFTIACVIEQRNLVNVQYEDYLIIRCDGQNVELNLALLKLLNCNFKHIVIQKTKGEIKLLLNKNFKNVVFDEIFLKPIKFPKNIFKIYAYIDTLFYSIDEGSLDYTNVYCSKDIEAEYLLYPTLLTNPTSKALKIDNHILKANITKLSLNSSMLYAKQSILLILGHEPVCIMDKLIMYCNILTTQGYTIYIKNHPRCQNSIEKDLNELCTKNKKVIYLKNEDLANVFIAEQLIYAMKPKMVISFHSTVLLSAWKLYNIPAFRLEEYTQDKYKYKEIDIIFSHVPYLSDFLKQDKFNAFDYANNYSFYYMNSLKRLLYKEAFYMPTKVGIYLKLFFMNKGLKSMKYFFYIMNHLMK